MRTEATLEEKGTLRVLRAGGNSQIFEHALRVLGRAYVVEHESASDSDRLHRCLAEKEWDLLLCDPALSDSGCCKSIEKLREMGSDLLVVALSDEVNEKQVVELLGAGVETSLDSSHLGRLLPLVARRREELRARRLRELQVLIESSPDPMLIVGSDGRIRHVNRLLEGLLGYSEAELAGHLIEVLVPDHARAGHAERRGRYMEAPHARPMGMGLELSARHKDGREIPVEISLGPVRLGGGSLVCCGVRDLRERKNTERVLRIIFEGTAADTGEQFLRSLLRSLAQALDVRYAFISVFPEAQAEAARVIAFWDGREFGEPFSYTMAGTPYAIVAKEGIAQISESVRASFPDDQRLRALGAESFFGVKLRDSAGKSLGVLAVVDTKPLVNAQSGRTVMQIFAARAGAELERLRAIAALKESEIRFRALTELSSDWYWETDERHRFTPVGIESGDKPWIRPSSYLGLARWEIPGCTPTREEWAAFRGALDEHRAFREFEYGRPSVDGVMRWVSVSGTPVFRPDGTFGGYRGVGRDITERKRNERQLKDREQQLSLIADNVPAMIGYCDSAFRYLYANRAYAQFYFEPGKSCEGVHMAEMLGAASYAAVRPGVERALAGERLTFDATRRRRDGRLRQVNVTLVPHWENGGRVKGVYMFILDVTAARQTEDDMRAREVEMRLLTDSLPAMIAYADSEQRFRYANRRYRDFYVRAGESVEGRTIAEILSEETMRGAGPSIERAYAGESLGYQAARRRRDGRDRIVEVSLVPNKSEDGRVLGIYILAIDVTRRQRAERMLRLRNRALESSVNSVMITEPTVDGQKITYVNPAFERTTGYTAAEAIGRSPRFLHGAERDQPGVLELRAAAKDEREGIALLRNFRKDGSLFWNEIRVAPVRDDAGIVTHFIGVGSDVTERVKYQEQIERDANYDALTGLPNRNLLDDRLAQAIANGLRTGLPAAVVYIDLDQFKRINDSLGHAVGDAVVAATAARLGSALRTGDTIARWGGDEFVAVLTNLKHEDDVARVAQKLRQAISAPLQAHGHEFVLSASIGIAIAQKDGEDGPTLLKHADAALYRAKADGRDCFRFFTAEMNTQAVRYLSIENDLRKALDAEELWLQYQPIVNLGTGIAVGAEALLRWKHPGGSMVSPADFIPVAEDSGLIVPIGRWIFRIAALQAAAWNRGRRTPLFVSVNLSARQFRDPGLVKDVRTAIAEAKIDPSLIKIEITESTVMHNADEAIRTLEALKDLGVLLSVDDFGTGYSSLSYLKRFPIDTLKIDRSFVRDLAVDRDDLAICRAVLDLAQGLELDVIAEGIETREQAETLADLGCRYAQGYLFSRPMDAGALVDIVGEGHRLAPAFLPREE